MYELPYHEFIEGYKTICIIFIQISDQNNEEKLHQMFYIFKDFFFASKINIVWAKSCKKHPMFYPQASPEFTTLLSH